MNYYIEFHENPTNYLLTVTRLRIDRWKGVVSTYGIYAWKESLKSSQLMLYRNKITISSEIHTKHMNTL